MLSTEIDGLMGHCHVMDSKVVSSDEKSSGNSNFSNTSESELEDELNDNDYEYFSTCLEKQKIVS